MQNGGFVNKIQVVRLSVAKIHRHVFENPGYIAEVKRELGLPMYDASNAEEELKQLRKHPTAEKVEAIKDALKYFGMT